MNRLSLALIAALLLSPLYALCADADGLEADSGYIICLAPWADLSLLPETAEEIWAPGGLYSLENLSGLGELVVTGVVEYVEPDCAVKLDALTDDPYSSEQWNLNYMEVGHAWDLGYTGAGVRIAIVDSGIYTGHEDLRGVDIEPGLNVIDGSTNTTDETGHGTFISGVIAAVSGNGKGISGICSGVTLVPFKCFGTGDEAEMSDIVSAIYSAFVDYDCDIINLSLGSDSYSRSLENVISLAEEAGVIVDSAVGNDGTTDLFYPAAYDSVIGVGSIGNSDSELELTDYAVSEFSQKNDSVFVCAPGASITSIGHDNHYYSGNGTSFATPHITALAALALSAYPELTPAQFRELLIATSTDLGEAGYDTSYGWGAANAARLVEQALVMKESTAEPVDVPKASMSNFVVDESFYKGFSDVDESLWYGADGQGWIKLAVSLGIMNGKGEGLFYPSGEGGNVLISEAIKMAAVVHSIYMGDGYVFDQSAGEYWYSTYADYALTREIISEGDFTDFTVPATRAQMAYIFSRALPKTELAAINDIGLDYIPDVGETAQYATNILMLYRSGVLTGYAETHAYSPDEYISRAESAAVISRISLADKRIAF